MRSTNRFLFAAVLAAAAVHPGLAQPGYPVGGFRSQGAGPLRGMNGGLAGQGGGPLRGLNGGLAGQGGGPLRGIGGAYLPAGNPGIQPGLVAPGVIGGYNTATPFAGVGYPANPFAPQFYDTTGAGTSLGRPGDTVPNLTNPLGTGNPPSAFASAVPPAFRPAAPFRPVEFPGATGRVVGTIGQPAGGTVNPGMSFPATANLNAFGGGTTGFSAPTGGARMPGMTVGVIAPQP